MFRAFNLYRLFMAGLLLAVFLMDPQARFLGHANPTLFLVTALVYIVFVLLSIVGSYLRLPPVNVQAHIQTLVDLIGLGLLIHASGGITSSLSILLVTAVAASGILLPLQSVLLAAALAFFMLIGYWSYDVWAALPAEEGAAPVLFRAILVSSEELVRLGILGASFFVAALLTYTLAERTRRTEELARQRSQELLAMADLNQAIVQQLQSGIIVVDHHARIRLINDMARDLLDRCNPAQGQPLAALSAPLNERLASWMQDPQSDPKPFRQTEYLPEINPKFKHLSNRLLADTLIFLEDSTQAAQRLQQIKLAALGRLTASIAHEIRNPLASISHAAQLLGESPSLATAQRRLAQIIHTNTKRANEIITNVQSLSRRDKLNLEDFALQPWLEEFCQEFLRSQGEKALSLDISVEPENLVIRFDPSHLHQILWNLCANACLHGTLPGEMPWIRLQAGWIVYTFSRPKPFLEVIDRGPGIPEAEFEKIFEPFFTTKALGTGLGLYIAREMCEANGVQLQYLSAPEGGSCFRITFATTSTVGEEHQWTHAMP